MIDLTPSIIKIQHSENNTEPVGAGFFITTAGHILTCRHVIDNIEDQNNIWVSWTKLNQPIKACFCEALSDPSDRKDFAILQIACSNKKAINLPPDLNIGVDCKPQDIIYGKGFQSSKFGLYPATGVVLGDSIRKKIIADFGF